MNIATVKYCDIANGPGVRTSVFVSGCRRHCPFCFNSVAWDFSYGQPFSTDLEDEIMNSLAPDYVQGITFLGGEPMEPENQRGLVDFVVRVREVYPHKDIWCYTGDTFDELQDGGPHHTEVTQRLLSCLDVLVDGPFKQELHDITLRFRGSSNQRLIDVPKTLETGSVVLWHDDPIYEAHANGANKSMH